MGCIILYDNSSYAATVLKEMSQRLDGGRSSDSHSLISSLGPSMTAEWIHFVCGSGISLKGAGSPKTYRLGWNGMEKCCFL